MKLLTHNMLTSNIIKEVKDGYPLKIEVSTNDFPCNIFFIRDLANHHYVVECVLLW